MKKRLADGKRKKKKQSLFSKCSIKVSHNKFWAEDYFAKWKVQYNTISNSASIWYGDQAHGE